MVRKADPRKGNLLKQSASEAREAWESSDLFDYTRDKIIVYVRTRDEAVQLASMLSCETYASKSGTPAEKKDILDRWTRIAS
jgi:hypothetical protein